MPARARPARRRLRRRRARSARRRRHRYHAFALREDALRPQPQEDHDEQPDGDPLQRGDQVRRQVVRGGDEPGDLLEPDRDQDGPEDRAEVITSAADDHGGEQHHGLGVPPGRRGPGGDVGDQDPAAQPGDGSPGHQHCGAQREQVLAQRVRDQVVVPHRTQAAPVGRGRDPAHEQVDGRSEDDRRHGEQPLVAQRLDAEHVVTAQRCGDQRQARVAVQQRPVVRDEQVQQNGGHQETHRGEVTAEPAAHQERERHGDQAADHRRADPRQRERQVPAADVGLEPAVGGVMRQGQGGRGVAARSLEDDETEVGDARHPELLAEAEAGHGVDRGVDQQVDEVEGVHRAPRLGLMSGRRAARSGAPRE
jgi:hypothetical protein